MAVGAAMAAMAAGATGATGVIGGPSNGYDESYSNPTTISPFITVVHVHHYVHHYASKCHNVNHSIWHRACVIRGRRGSAADDAVGGGVVPYSAAACSLAPRARRSVLSSSATRNATSIACSALRRGSQ